MVRPDDISQFLDNRWFDSLAGLGSWVINILVSALILFAFYVLWQYFEHKIKITVFPVYGMTPLEAEKIKAFSDLKENHVEIGQPKFMRGKDIKEKGIRKFSVALKPMLPFLNKKIKTVPFELRYPDGIWMLQPTKDTFIPIPRPHMSEVMNINVPDTSMDLWQQSADDIIKRRTQDENAMKMQMYMTVAIIIGAFVLSGVIIWLSMSFAGNSINEVLVKVEPMTSALQNLAEAGGPG